MGAPLNLVVILAALAGLFAFSLIVVVMLAISGAVRLAQGLRMRPARGWGWMAASGAVFAVVKFAGAAYLVWLGARMLWGARHGAGAPRAQALRASASRAKMFRQAFLVTLLNPKALVFFVAFAPQFIDPTLPAGPQLWAMCGAFLVIAVVFDSCYAVVGGRLLSAIKSAAPAATAPDP